MPISRGALLSLALTSALAPALTGCASTAPTATVQWQPWERATFERAAAERRPILVSVVAEWCHWCHVMDNKTYADPGVARLISEGYVAVRVDSDARPDIAERYRAWGWPATAILTPDARPLLERQGFQEPDAFEALLQGVADDIAAGRDPARAASTQPAAVAESDLIDALDDAEEQLAGLYDDERGGWGGSRKYPLAAPIELQLLMSHVHEDESATARVTQTLAGQTQLTDPVWGGLYQYSERGVWDRPHFVKIALVQADGIDSFARAYRHTGDERWLQAARDVERYVREFLTSPQGGFYSSQDAGVGAHDDTVPWVDGHDYYPLADAERRAIGMPRIDRAVYADRTGRLIQALAQLHQATLDADTLRLAERAAQDLLARHGTPQRGFRHAGGEAGSDASPLLHLTDQVAVGRAFLALAESTGEHEWIDRSVTLAMHVLDALGGESPGALFAHTGDPAAVGVFAERRRPFRENARAARWFLRLDAVTGDRVWRERAALVLRDIAARETVKAQGRRIGDFAMALSELAYPPVIVTVVGAPDDPVTQRLHDVALTARHPNRVIERAEPGGHHGAFDKPAILLCTASACSAPLWDAETIQTDLQTLLDASR